MSAMKIPNSEFRIPNSAMSLATTKAPFVSVYYGPRRAIMRRFTFLFLLASVCVVSGCGQSSSGGDSEDLSKYIRQTTPSRRCASPCATGHALCCGLHAGRRLTFNTYPILMTRTPYSSGPYGEDKFPEKLGPSKEFARERYIFVKTDVRGRFMSEGEFDNMRPIIENKTGTDRRNDRHLGHGGVADQQRGEQQRQGRDLGQLLPWLLHRDRRSIDTHPAIKAAHAVGADRRLVLR